jgi:hypothetical protein
VKRSLGDACQTQLIMNGGSDLYSVEYYTF